MHAKLPNNKVAILEKSSKLLSKVKVSGGGRCNVTNSCDDIEAFSKFYPRGERQLKRAFLSIQPTINYELVCKQGVQLYAQPDNRMFPTSNNSQTIIDCLMSECKTLGIDLFLNSNIESIQKKDDLFFLVKHSHTNILLPQR
ncbi:MAG: NAD(P)/FAD-dependent oxidoreductase [Crocinitomicaceae bacterium]